ncbi:MAG: prolyl oligopeptidase family serine peptidase [Tannerella sp.]|nr:prolyl oligopeptidase family serine peptidase [Tannerella sp.]
MKIKRLIFIALTLIPGLLFSQKKPLDHSVYDSWESITLSLISNNGLYAVHQVGPQEGDSLLTVTHLPSLSSVQIERGYRPQFTDDSKTLVFLIKPTQAEKKQARKEKKPAAEMPQDSLGILRLGTKHVEKIAAVKSYQMSEKASDFFACTTAMPKDTVHPDRKDEKHDYLIVYRFLSGQKDTIPFVANYTVSKNGKYLSYITKPSEKDSIAVPGIYLYDPATQQSVILKEGKGEYKSPVFDETGDQLVFYATADTTKNESKLFNLYYTSTAQPAVRAIADTLSVQMPDKWSVNAYHEACFSKNGAKLYFGISPIIPPRDTTVDESEKVKLDVWFYDDDYLPTYQLKQLDKELKRSCLCVFDVKDLNRFVQLGSPELEEIVYSDKGNGEHAVGFSTVSYRKESQWTGIVRNDVYVISTTTGEKKLLAEGMDTRPGFSPAGNYLLWFDRTSADWYVYSIVDGQTRCLTAGLEIAFEDARAERPDKPGPFGGMGWSENDRYVYLYDQYDIWQFDPVGQLPPKRLTDGRERQLTFRNIRLTNEYEYLKAGESFLLSAFDNVSKESGFYTLSPKKGLKKLTFGKYSFSTPVKAKNAEVFIYTKSNFNTTPDLWETADWWKKETQLSHINPQMKDYLWGTAELVHWMSKDSFPLEGILYKPENFDPAKKYPMIIYFYERHADELYRHFMPTPSRSIINIPFFCSRGYLVFTPNIHYVDGHPGRSACHSIIAGAEMLCQYPWVDKEHIGIQGQSWGGYQVAFLITQTNMFAAAGAGAPVSNMASAYGGIRWESGLNRQMQYERQQSRIGKTLWEARDLYIENSPLFFADKVETPLLMTHNDNDGAVPWYQGIEYFTALRRLGKTVWMLQYNGEAHNLTQRRNMCDLSIRLQQFFDHYLKGDPMPAWMKYGIPATKKGRTDGLELTTE